MQFFPPLFFFTLNNSLYCFIEPPEVSIQVTYIKFKIFLAPAAVSSKNGANFGKFRATFEISSQFRDFGAEIENWRIYSGKISSTVERFSGEFSSIGIV